LPKTDGPLGDWLKSRWASKESKLEEFYSEEDQDKRSFRAGTKERTYELTLGQHLRRFMLAFFWFVCTLLWIWMLFRLPYQLVYCGCIVAFYVVVSQLPGGISDLYT